MVTARLLFGSGLLPNVDPVVAVAVPGNLDMVEPT